MLSQNLTTFRASIHTASNKFKHIVILVTYNSSSAGITFGKSSDSILSNLLPSSRLQYHRQCIGKYRE